MDEPESPKTGGYNQRRGRTVAERDAERHVASLDPEIIQLRNTVKVLQAEVKRLQQWQQNLKGEGGIEIAGSTFTYNGKTNGGGNVFTAFVLSNGIAVVKRFLTE